MSCIPSNSSRCQELTSRMTLSAWSIHVLLLPTDDEGTRLPSSLMPATSTSATSSGPRNPSHAICATWDRCTSMYCIRPELIFSRLTGSDWYGSRSSIPSVAARVRVRDPGGERGRHGLGVAGSGEAAHADGRAARDQGRRVLGTHDPAPQLGSAHGWP